MLDWLFTHTPLFYLTQSLWRDEAFSILIAERPISSFIGKLTFEPPLYYILLHIWIKIFGNSEIAARSLSLLGLTLATVVIIFWAEKTFKKHFLSWLLPVLFFLNPMLLYYGFEVRAYGWFMFFATLSLVSYLEKKPGLLAVSNILVFYTHSYGILLPVIQFIHYAIVEKKWKLARHPKKLIHDVLLRGFVLSFVSYLPWLFLIVQEMRKLRTSWYFPVDLQLVGSVLGNMFIGYDGTPGGLWLYTALLSALLLILFLYAVSKKKTKKDTSLLFITILLPLTLLIGISFFKPLFVNRYLIYSTIAQVLLLAYAIHAIKNPTHQKILTGIILLFIILVNIYFPAKKAKFDARSVIAKANAVRLENDVLYIKDPLIFFEAVYYTPDRHNVFLYNQDGSPFPWYVGEAAFSPSQMAYEMPEYPARAVIVDTHDPVTIAFRSSGLVLSASNR